MRFCLLLMWGVTLSSSTSLRRELTPIELIADAIPQYSRINTRELQDTADGFDNEADGFDEAEGTGGSSAPPEVTGTNPAAPAPLPVGNDVIPGNENPDPVINDSGNAPANMAGNLDPVINDSGNAPTTQPVQMAQPVKTTQPVQTAKAVQTVQPTVSPTLSPSHRPTIRPTMSPTKSKIVIPVIPTQIYPDEEEDFGVMHALAFVFFGAIVALAIRYRDSIRNLIPADAGARASKRSGRYQEM
jgi:hypothetical protein